MIKLDAGFDFAQPDNQLQFIIKNYPSTINNQQSTVDNQQLIINN